MRLKLINNFTLTLPYLIKIRTSDFHKLLQLLITKKKKCGKNASPPSKPYVKNPSSKNLNLNLCTELL